ncbi:MAG: N-6 DNA methylase, partial [Dehalococcoidia bacterium]|nr:N-6 DNA methylase [Dehalococcoidia bacterium]
MLDAGTRSRIDSARDILVGKVPDPKSQVEQITIALIYKFMDDMDRQSEELGGKASFFTGDFSKYRWAQLLDKRFSGHERLRFYAEGIEKMNENKNIPQLFRDIFRGVFLPYRDPETLNLFLKEINGFTYDNSERLGNAFEYLLSVLGTQGDAGQFRTPRHIIDFIVAVVDPKKNQTVLDPACGTAGFLISAFKHIMKNNETLTQDERARLMDNFRGYDISPDMVRLSRVNMYLHRFPNPVIHEYDALTSEERWDERCDVILTNPPFMSPRGGVRPHNRFSIKANRSEVLFVDYIAEHLNPGGRAGVIVPEGIIFQGQNAYKGLRKMLVENYLWAVVSLPSGVFNPYSGVKTSILFFDRNLAGRTDNVLFVKVENDGFDLGAQRRPLGKNDLTEALEILDGHKKEQQAQESKLALTVSRKRLLESPDINLSGDRYRVAAVRHAGKWPIVKLGEVCTFEYGSSLPERKRIAGQFPVIGSNGIAGYHSEFTVKGPTIVVGRKGSAGEVTWIEQNCVPIDTTYFVQLRKDSVSLRYLFYTLQRLKLKELRGGAGVPGLNRNDTYGLEIPLPPLDEQQRIVEELEGYRKVIEGARQILAAYKPAIRIDPEWPIMPLGDVITLQRGYDLPKMQFAKGHVPV